MFSLRLLGTFDAKINEPHTPLHISLNNSVIRPSLIEGKVQGDLFFIDCSIKGAGLVTLNHSSLVAFPLGRKSSFQMHQSGLLGGDIINAFSIRYPNEKYGLHNLFEMIPRSP